MTTILFSLLLTASNVVQAAGYEVSLDTGVMGTSDEQWDKVQYNRSIPGAGLTMGTEISESISLLAGFHTGTVGSIVYTTADEDAEYVAWDEPNFHIASTIDQYSMAARWRMKLLPRLTPTVTGSAILAHGRLRMDEDIELDGSEVELKYVSVVPGASVGAGLEYTLLYLANKQVRINVGFEAGYTYLAPFNFKDRDSAKDPLDIGKLGMNGAHMRWSIGTRF
jgi:hypothetical protein